MSSSDEAVAKACCADLYQSDLARLLLGDSLHPGGLALTHRLGQLLGLGVDQWVADLASGRGDSALALSRVFRCRVVGVEFGQALVAEARRQSLASVSPARAYFLRGDAEQLPLRSGSFDAVLTECSLSLFPNQARAMGEAARLLRPGGKLGLSDVTVTPGSLPPLLDQALGQMLCLSDALDLAGYRKLVEDAGLTPLHQEDASGELLKLLDELAGKLAGLLAWLGPTGPAALPPGWLEEAPALIELTRELVQSGRLGYWLIVAEKRG